MFGVVQYQIVLNVLILKFSVSNLFNLVKETELPLIGNKLLTRHITCNFFLVCQMCSSIFPFYVWDKLWVLIQSVPEVSSQI